MPGKYAITLARSSIEPFLQSSTRRDLREKAFLAWIARGDGGGATDNKAIIAETVRLRAERARLLGYPTFARYRLDDAMAKTPEAVRALLERVWKPARDRAMADRDALQALAQAEGGNFALAPWDWRYYAEKLRKARFDIDAGRNRTVSVARQDHRSGLRHRRPPVRPRLPRAPRRAGVAPRRPRLGGHRPRRPLPRAVLRRLLRALQQTQRRLDDDAAHPGKARRRHPPARYQRHELRQGRRRRADAAVLRRCPHPVPRIRPRPAWPPVGRDLSR